ncbi:MAG: hypothetical protein AAGI23_14235 [Bacteroidota bacterium]
MRFSVLIVLIYITTPLFGQSGSLVEQLGGIKTSFTISNGDETMEILSQAIVKRGLSQYHTDYD